MLLTEYNEAETMELFRAEGRIEGRAEGAALLGTLIAKLFSLGRTEDAKRAAMDETFRNKLYQEFQLS